VRWVLVLGILSSFLGFIPNGYWIQVFTTILLWIAMAQGLNLILGLAGYPAFGNGAFMGVGAYTLAILMNHGSPLLLALLTAGALSFALAFLLGLPVLRLRGHYFAIATIGINFALLALVENLGITGGGSGLTTPLVRGSPEAVGRLFYFSFWLLALLATALVAWIRQRPLGYALRAIRSSEEVARSIGIPTTRAKILAWSLSALITGLAGGLYAYWNGFLEPGQVFNINHSVELFIMVLLGGAGTIWGPVIGAIGLQLVALLLWSNLGQLHLVFLGLVVLLVAVYLPEGVLGHRFVLRRKT
jgi:branched-chain amino acid transport system permease protein